MSKKGLRCQVCTGCGRCREDGLKGISFVLQNALTEEHLSGLCGHVPGKRLVTVDIGTTTVAMQLHGRDGSVEDYLAEVNPQVSYGADVLSRIQAAARAESAQDMQRQVLEVLQQGFEQFKKVLSEGESLFAVIAANTTMTYLLLGYDTGELGQAPFCATYLEAVSKEIGGVDCLICPGLSAFVGGDIVAGLFACDMFTSKELTLLIDLGTNGEMVLGNCDRMIACATAAGPAFEGGVNRGVWGADMVRILAALRQEGIVDETGLLCDTYFESGIRAGDVLVTQESIRAIQLAKGAISAGIRILVQEYGITMEDIHRVVLAGGFGYFLDVDAAATIRLLPDSLKAKTISGGNTALAGALKIGSGYLQQGMNCLNRLDRNRIEVLNLAQVPSFEEWYLEGMGL